MKIRTLECNKNFGKKLRNHLIEKIAYQLDHFILFFIYLFFF